MLYPAPQRFNGLPVHIVPDIPKMRLAEDCPVSDTFRAEVNQWMVEFFGTTNIMSDGTVHMLNAKYLKLGNPHKLPDDNYAVMNPRTFVQLKRQLNARYGKIGN